MSFSLPYGSHRFTKVVVNDEPAEGGAYHDYSIMEEGEFPKYSHLVIHHILFQKGPVKEVGVNGIFMEDLLNICRHRLECFQAGPYACRENALALTKIQEALHWLDHRTADRQARNVEGTSGK